MKSRWKWEADDLVIEEPAEDTSPEQPEGPFDPYNEEDAAEKVDRTELRKAMKERFSFKLNPAQVKAMNVFDHELRDFLADIARSIATEIRGMAEKVEKFDPHQPRDKGGKWTSVAGDEAPETPPTALFHGTATKFIASIKEHGLRPAPAVDGKGVYADRDKNIALSWGMTKAADVGVGADQWGPEGKAKLDKLKVALVVIKAGNAGLKPGDQPPGSARQLVSTRTIKPEFIDRIEIYNYRDLIAARSDPGKRLPKGRTDYAAVTPTRVFLHKAETPEELFAVVVLDDGEDDAEKLEKARTPKAITDKLVRIDWDRLVPGAETALRTVAREGGYKALASLDMSTSEMIAEVNEIAAEWARDRAAEMVGRKWVRGRLVENPNAEWAIDATTRDEIQRIVTEAFEHQTNMADLAEEILDAGAFSEGRASMIARTEVSRAANQGNLTGWRVSGKVKMVDWHLSDDHDNWSDCHCSERAENGPYPINRVPQFPAHPNCWCALVPAEVIE